ncbi:hypothetical protein BDV97DRAFT_354265 [Delphinella strobiligena]|nr:hypothetical protein BDV97DRAFT_354265 [Delphinella strobiligena]
MVLYLRQRVWILLATAAHDDLCDASIYSHHIFRVIILVDDIFVDRWTCTGKVMWKFRIVNRALNGCVMRVSIVGALCLVEKWIQRFYL